jgi:hypothetical protein
LTFEQYEVCIAESENLGCHPKIAKFGAIFPLKRQYKNLVGLTKDNYTIWSLHKDEPTKQCLTIKHLKILVIFCDFKIAP